MDWDSPTSPIARKFYLRIWLAVVGSVILFCLAVGWAWHAAQQEHDRRLKRDVTVLDANNHVLASGPARLQHHASGGGFDLMIALNGEPITIQMTPRTRETQEDTWWSLLRPPYGFVCTTVFSGLVIMIGVFPIARQLTRRLEKLQQGMQRWGEGDLSVRVSESGYDEVADLARHFNTAAEHVTTLIQAQKSLLANASHELRSPLARIRMAVELSGVQNDDPASAAIRAEIRHNIDELDQLVGEILLTSRLDAKPYDMGEVEPVDITGVLAEECARVDATLNVAPSAASGGASGAAGLIVQGVPRLLHRAVRNLLENACRYGRQADSDSEEVSALLECADDGDILIHINDHGPGVPPDLRERIFEPFYRLPGASEREGGVGLGLALVRSIAERHGGSATCGECEGGGACFTLRLPRNAAAPAAA